MTHRARAFVALLALSLALSLPSTAFAGSDQIVSGWIGTTGAYGPRHSLTSVWATWSAGSATLINALNENGTWAGTSYIAHPGGVVAGHLYCGCVLRYGWGGASSGSTQAYVRQFW